MKKTLIIILSLISYSLLSQNLTGNKEISMEVVFGGPRCNGAPGLCIISQGGSGKPGNTKFTSLKNGEYQFQLIFHRKHLSEGEEKKITGNTLPLASTNTTFIMEDTLILDDDTLDDLNIDSEYNTIPAGNYQMSINKDYVIIDFILIKP